jgi:acyl-[acyl-carrier-protein]-phospholipid O-acyltransferase/long-chain-fatty-acid--[acyl-carrier-protein] ligase
MSEMLFDSADKDKTLYQSLLDQVHLHGRKHVIAEEASRQKMNYGQLLMRSTVLGDALSRQTQKGEFVGILLPNALSTVVTFFALQAYGRVPAMLNFSTGAHSLCSSCQTAQLRRVITARKFIEAANLQALVDALQAQAIRVEYLEEIAAGITRWDKLKGLVGSHFPCLLPIARAERGG